MDVVIYVGDWMSILMFDVLMICVVCLIGVCGNNDVDLEFVRFLEIVIEMIEGVCFVVVYEIGVVMGCEVCCVVWFLDVDVLVFGYSYIFWDSIVVFGF